MGNRRRICVLGLAGCLCLASETSDLRAETTRALGTSDFQMAKPVVSPRARPTTTEPNLGATRPDFELTLFRSAKPLVFGSTDAPAPLPVQPRDQAEFPARHDGAAPDQLPADLAQALRAQGLGLHAFQITGNTSSLEVENRSDFLAARAVGRAARALTRTMPPEIDRFEVTIVEHGVPVSTVRLARSDIETLEHDLDGSWISYVRSEVDSPNAALQPVDGLYPSFEYSITPHAAIGVFDADGGLRADIALDLNARFALAPGMVLQGTFRQKLAGNIEDAPPITNLAQPNVRTDARRYAQADSTIPTLTGAYYFNASDDLFGRITAGYLEPMFGGVSTELLWRPHDRHFAIGAEVNYAVQRDFDQLFGFQDYDIVTGHISGYWDIGDGLQAQLDVGRYLAGDWGGTLSLAREFENGWRIGAFATLTDMSEDQFGIGDFDHGVMLTIPVGWSSGPGLSTNSEIELRPVLGNGGAKLDVNGRLYDLVAPSSGPQLASGWEEFWR